MNAGVFINIIIYICVWGGGGGISVDVCVNQQIQAHKPRNYSPFLFRVNRTASEFSSQSPLTKKNYANSYFTRDSN